MSAPLDVLDAIDGLRDLARHRLTTKRREFDKMIAAGKEPHWQILIKADRAEYLVQQGNEARAAIADLIAERDALREALRYAIKQVPELATVPGIATALALTTGESA